MISCNFAAAKMDASWHPSSHAPPSYAQPLAFSGIHVISPRLLTMMTEEGAFPIIATYLRLAARAKTFSPFAPINIIGAISARPGACAAS